MSSEVTFAETWHMFAGDEIGIGATRVVYAHRHDPNLVIKVDDDTHSFYNIHEYSVWQDWQYCPKVSRWLAPCVDISPWGVVLLQRRVVPLRKNEMPKSLPEFLTDLKPSNFGWLDGKIVCCDYASVIKELSLKRKRVRTHAS